VFDCILGNIYMSNMSFHCIRNLGTCVLSLSDSVARQPLNLAACFPAFSCFLQNNSTTNNIQFKALDLQYVASVRNVQTLRTLYINPLNPELNPIFYLLALLGAHHFLHVSRIRVKLLTFRRLMSYIYGAPILDVSRSHTTTQHSR